MFFVASAFLGPSSEDMAVSRENSPVQGSLLPAQHYTGSWQPNKCEKIALVTGNRPRAGRFEENGAALEAVWA